MLPKKFIERLISGTDNEEDLRDTLNKLGLTVIDAASMNLIDEDEYDEPYEYYDESDQNLRLPKADISNYIKEINKDQLLCVLARFDSQVSTNNVTVDRAQALIDKALGTPEKLKQVIAKLNPLEETLLLHVKHSGGVINGWELILHAIKLGFKPEELEEITSLYRVEASEHLGTKFLIPLLRDGLLLPSSTYASWFERFYYGYEQSLDIDNDILQVDPRILAVLADKKPPKAQLPKFKKLKDVESGFSQKHPVETILKLNEVLKLIASSGGLQTNKDGSISKNAIKKLIKLAPWLEDEFDNYLNIIQSLDFLKTVSEDGKNILKLKVTDTLKFQASSLAEAYATVLTGYFASPSVKYDPSGAQYGITEVINLGIARKALVDAVCLLPKDAVDIDAALAVLWKHSLQYVMRAKISRSHYGSSKTVEERHLPKWFRHSILQELHDFGLVALKETGQKDLKEVQVANNYFPKEFKKLDATHYAIQVTSAKDWWQQSREHNKKPSKDKAAQKSLLLQANFDILVYLDMLTPEAITVLNCADCTRIDAQTANYTISRASIYRALEMGMSLESILQLLEDNSHDLPNNVKVSITEWASRRERLSVTENTTLLEYPTTKARDAALKKLSGSRAVAERFLLVTNHEEIDENATTLHNYRAEPKRIIEFKDDGGFTLNGASDLAGRAVLASLAEQDKKGNYALNTKAIQAGAFTKVAKESLLKRTKGGLPEQVTVLIDIWSGKTSAPAIGQVSVFQHASAQELAKHPSIAPLLAGQLGATSFLIVDGKVTELNKTLKTLGIVPNKTVEQNLEPQIVEKQESMKKGLPTRKMREMIESAISNEQSLKLKYNDEKHSYDRYGYTRVSKGKAVTEEIVPDSVYYEGSTPYFYGKTVNTDKGRDVRIGYITEIQVL